MAARVAVHRSWFVAFGVGILFVALAFLHPLRAHAATITVDTTNDTIVGGQCSLRGAITAVNTQTAQGNCIAGDGINDTIKFNISPNGGVKTISVGSALPALIKPMTINGYSQPGASANTLATGDNANILIELDGTNAGTGMIGLAIVTGAGGTVIEGLAINRFSAGIVVNGVNATITGNFIGTNAAGTAALGNAIGVAIVGSASGNTIGGMAAGARNLISGNTNGSGVIIQDNGTTGNVVEGNYIGTNAAGTTALPNSIGVNVFSASGNTIGGTAAGARNVIAGNTLGGVLIQSSGNTVEGNYVGTSAAGTAALANGIGVYLFNGASGNTIGGSGTGAGNLLSGNKVAGVFIQDSSTTGNVVAGNLIGTNAAGTMALANTNGVVITQGASGNTVGGTMAGAGNTVAFNTLFGVSVGSSTTDTTINNAVLGNSIHDNGGATGLDLGQDGVTPNGMNPRSLPNDGQNYPVLTAAYGSTVTGTLDSVASATFRVEFFASPSGATGGRNGQTFLGFVTATTDGSGHADLTFTAASALPAGSIITATATNTTVGAQMNDTSEFSAPLPSGITATAGTPQSALINQAFGTALAATVTDSTGTGLANIPVTFTAPASGASGVFTPGPGCTVTNGGASATCLTNASGIATAPTYTANGTAGADTVVASVPGVTSTASFMLQNLAPLTSIALTGPGGATAPTLKVGQSVALMATGTYADHSTQPLPPGQVQWQSSNPSVVKVDTSGNVTAESPGGPVTITATFNGVTGQIFVTVTAPTPIGITVPPAPQNRPSGATSGASPAPSPAPAPAPRSGKPPLPAVGSQSGTAPLSSPAPAPLPPSR